VVINFKEHGEVAVATDKSHGGYGRRGRWWRVLFWSTFNVVLGVALQVAVQFVMTRTLHLRSPLRITRTLPLPFGIIKDLVRGFALREVCSFSECNGFILTPPQLLSYLLHRYGLHSARAPLRSQHLAWHHGLPAPYSLVAHYDHPLAYLLRVVLPTYIPAAIFRFHLLTYHLFLALVSLEELFVYSGYTYLPSGFILGRMARRQELHLMTNGKGNFSPYGAADLLAGTAMGSDVFEDILEEAERKELSEKAQKKVRQVGKQAKGRKDKAMKRLRGQENDED
jgi:hypothetical protein